MRTELFVFLLLGVLLMAGLLAFLLLSAQPKGPRRPTRSTAKRQAAVERENDLGLLLAATVESRGFPERYDEEVGISDAASAVPPFESRPVSPRALETQDHLGVEALNEVKPPQFGDPSAFAKYDWWDPSRDWWLLSESGGANDTVCDLGTVGSLAVAAVSMRGHKHRYSGQVCQDSFAVRVARTLESEQFLVVVVCDGLSSAKFSHFGAKRTAELFSEELKKFVESTAVVSYTEVVNSIPKLLDNCRNLLKPERLTDHGIVGITNEEITEEDLYTTLTFAVIPTTGDGETRTALVGGIGDSPIFHLGGDLAEWKAVRIDLTTSDVVDSGTHAFPASGAPAIEVLRLADGDVLSIMSDGVGNYVRVGDKQTLLGNYLARQWRRPVGLATYVSDVAFDLKSADDDRTVVTVWIGRR
jgi:serine/threonine protein phosphatase PrpC